MMKSIKINTVFGLILLSVASYGQEHIHILSSDTIRSGDVITYGGHVISSPNGMPFIIEGGGRVNMIATRKIELSPGFKSLNESYLSATVLSFSISDSERNEGSITVYPNPTERDLIVKSSQVIRSARLTDINGVMIIEMNRINTDSFTMDVSGLRPGIYLIEVSTDGQVEKIRVQKN